MAGAYGGKTLHEHVEELADLGLDVPQDTLYGHFQAGCPFDEPARSDWIRKKQLIHRPRRRRTVSLDDEGKAADKRESDGDKPEKRESDGDKLLRLEMQEKQLRVAWQAKRIEQMQIAIDKQKGKLVDKVAAVKAWMNIANDARLQLEALPERLDGLIHDPEMKALVVGEVRSFVDGFLETLAKGGSETERVEAAE